MKKSRIRCISTCCTCDEHVMRYTYIPAMEQLHCLRRTNFIIVYQILTLSNTTTLCYSVNIIFISIKLSVFKVIYNVARNTNTSSLSIFCSTMLYCYLKAHKV